MNLPKLNFEPYPGLENSRYTAVQDVMEFQRTYVIGKFGSKWAIRIYGKDANPDDMTFHDSLDDAKDYANTVNIVYMQNVHDRIINKPYLERYTMIEPDKRPNYTCAGCGTNKSVKYLVRTTKRIDCKSLLITEVPMCHMCFFSLNNSIYGIHGSHSNIEYTEEDIKKAISDKMGN